MAMDIKMQAEGGTTVAVLTGDFDALSAPEFDNTIKAIENAKGGMIIDLSAVKYIASIGLRSILMAAKKARLAGGELALCAPSAQVEKVLALSGFDRICPVFKTQQEALARLSKGTAK